METSTPIKKYRLGNQDVELALITDYLGWIPTGFSDPAWESWDDADCIKRLERDINEPRVPSPLTLIDPINKIEVELLMHVRIIKDAISEIYAEQRANDWWRFCIVSKQETPEEKFIIPLH